MDQVKFVEDSLSSTQFTWAILEYFVPFYSFMILRLSDNLHVGLY